MGNRDQAFLTQRLVKAFEGAWKDGRVILFSAPCGCGKTTSAMALLKNRTALPISFATKIPDARSIPPGIEVVYVDDLHLMSNPDDQQRLLALMRTRRDLHFLLAGRCRIPGWLMPFRLAGELAVIGINDLFLDQETTRRMFDAQGITLSQTELIGIDHDVRGYPIALALLRNRLAGDQPYREAIFNDMKRELFVYLEDAVFDRLPQATRRLLINCAFVESLDIDLAKTVSGNSRAGEIISSLLKDSSMLLFDGLDTYHFWPVFQEFLQWEAKQRLSDEELRESFDRAALHYELTDDVASALDFYSRAGDLHKVREMLERNADLHPGTGHYLEMGRYYLALPQEEIRRSPVLICGMSMLCAMSLDFEASDAWYEELRGCLAKTSRKDPDYGEILGRIFYLDIALPQSGVKRLPEVISHAAELVAKGQVRIPAFSVTSMMPSIMNGGKDFSDWSKRDDLLYATLSKPVEAVLGADGVGLADCAICESKFEKGRDVSSRLLTLMSRQGEIQAKGTPDIEFALEGLLVRAQVAQGRAAVALSSLENMRARFVERGETRFLANIDAMICRVRLRLNDTYETNHWLEYDAPADGSRLWVFWRYRYITKMQVLIAQNRCEEALLVAAQLLPYCERCGRVLDGVTLRLLSAICQERMGDATWREEMRQALDACHEYSFVMPVAQLGAAILPLIGNCEWSGDATFLARLTSATRTQAIRYPRFLSPGPALTEPLSAAELQVLRLICHNMSNKHIAETLDVKMPTVKTHVSHILQKLGVDNRTEAKAVAEQLHLV